MASRSAASFLSSFIRSPRTVSPSVLRPYPRLPRTLQPAAAARRFAHTIPKPSRSTPPASSSPSASSQASEDKPRKQLEPHYELTFTCVPCSGRSTHTISKQGYHTGSVLITCPTCRNRHIISDNLNIFGDRKITIEDLMREKGQLVKRGTLGEDGDVEFWEDGTVTDRGASAGVGAGNATGATGATADAANELDASVEEEEARKMRDARNPSSQSTDPTATAPSTPLTSSGARPSVDSTANTNAVPSTRRQYSTTMRKVDGPELAGAFEELGPSLDRAARRRKRNDEISALRDALRDGVDLEPGLVATTDPPAVKQRGGDEDAFSQFRRIPQLLPYFRKVSSWSEDYGAKTSLSQVSSDEQVSISREAVRRSHQEGSEDSNLLRKVPVHNAGRPNLRNPESPESPIKATPAELQPNTKEPYYRAGIRQVQTTPHLNDREATASASVRSIKPEHGFQGVGYDAYKPLDDNIPGLFRRVESRTPPDSAEAKVRHVQSETHFNGVRLVNVANVDNRPRYVRTSPGPFLVKSKRPADELPNSALKTDKVNYRRSKTSHARILDTYSKATQDLWGDTDLSQNLRKMIEQTTPAKSRSKAHGRALF